MFFIRMDPRKIKSVSDKNGASKPFKWLVVSF
ncbi:hypothetical protein LSS_22255 [Leptospira santarosai serovar Shermani str. LT 821]|uniref:Uncharacterized protein n=1 Tax=Leptospira santarosai serovar Shermani str. LT 821 TaxID=758847 RepID=A0A097ESQ8_9LEPT|nr:hypothetical protein LSS_22255 [Leptospira santarosai serovar Shermani str. LT 821]